MRKLSFKYFVFGLLAIISFAYYILHTTYYIPPALATTQSCPTQSPYPRVKEGLLSAPGITDTIFSQEKGICVVDSERAAFRSIDIPNYDTLKAQYFDNAKPPTIKQVLPGDQTQSAISLPAGPNKVYHIQNGNLTISSNITVSTTGVVFVDRDLTINSNLTNTNNNTGLVFVVKGNVIIASSVTLVNAVLISSGTIYTAGTGCSTSEVVASQLVINGSLISIYKDRPQADSCTANWNNNTCPLITFCRKLAGNDNDDTAAEQIKQQPKYLVILKDIVADTLQTWSELP